MSRYASIVSRNAPSSDPVRLGPGGDPGADQTHVQIRKSTVSPGRNKRVERLGGPFGILGDQGEQTDGSGHVRSVE